jgi:biopolymer transport protein ExbD
MQYELFPLVAFCEALASGVGQKGGAAERSEAVSRSILRGSMRTILLLLLMSSSANGDAGPGPSTEKLIKTAEHVYAELFEVARRSESIGIGDVESLATWSRRILVLELTEAGYWEAIWYADGFIPNADQMGATLLNSLRLHIRRMKALEELVRSCVVAGKGAQTVAVAAQYFRLEAECILAKVEAAKKEMHDRLLEIEVPPATSPVPLITGSKPLIIRINKVGSVQVEGKEIPLESLKKVLADRVKSDPNTSILIRANRDTKHAAVVTVMDLCARFDARISVVVDEGPE